MDEVTRNLIAKWGMPTGKARRREEEIRRHFPEALVEGFEPLAEVITHDPGDRHVLAAAVRSHAELIVTYNRRHFRQLPSGHGRSRCRARLGGLCDLEAGLLVRKLHEQAEAIGTTLEYLLRSLSKNVPGFVEYFCEEQGIRLCE
jgi:hypothetical protein